MLKQFFIDHLHDGLTDHGEIRPSDRTLRALSLHCLNRDPWKYLALMIDSHQAALLGGAMTARLLKPDAETDQEVLLWLDLLMKHAARRTILEHEHQITQLLINDFGDPENA